MKNFFKLHDYSENLKARVTTFNFKGKEDICWEYVKNVKGIWEEELILDEFERLFKKKYMSEMYYDDRDKVFYELHMGSMIANEYTSRFLELLRYVPYLRDEKVKI